MRIKLCPKGKRQAGTGGQLARLGAPVRLWSLRRGRAVDRAGGLLLRLLRLEGLAGLLVLVRNGCGRADCDRAGDDVLHFHRGDCGGQELEGLVVDLHALVRLHALELQAEIRRLLSCALCVERDGHEDRRHRRAEFLRERGCCDHRRRGCGGTHCDMLNSHGAPPYQGEARVAVKVLHALSTGAMRQWSAETVAGRMRSTFSGRLFSRAIQRVASSYLRAWTWERGARSPPGASRAAGARAASSGALHPAPPPSGGRTSSVFPSSTWNELRSIQSALFALACGRGSEIT